MSLYFDNDEYELSTSVEMDNLLAELPFNLMRETINDQIDHPVDFTVNYLDVVIEKCNVCRSMSGDPDIQSQIDNSLKEFIIGILRKMDEAFDLGLDLNSISESSNVIEIGTVLYTFFILRYRKNISRFISKFILQNKKKLVQEFTDNNKKDVSTLALKKQVRNRDDLVIVANLPSIIKYVINLDISPADFITLSAGTDSYEGAVILALINSNRLIGNFVRSYFDASVDDHDYILDEIQTAIKLRITKKIT